MIAVLGGMITTVKEDGSTRRFDTIEEFNQWLDDNDFVYADGEILRVIAQVVVPHHGSIEKLNE